MLSVATLKPASSSLVGLGILRSLNRRSTVASATAPPVVASEALLLAPALVRPLATSSEASHVATSRLARSLCAAASFSFFSGSLSPSAVPPSRPAPAPEPAPAPPAAAPAPPEAPAAAPLLAAALALARFFLAASAAALRMVSASAASRRTMAGDSVPRTSAAAQRPATLATPLWTSRRKGSCTTWRSTVPVAATLKPQQLER